MTSTTTRFAATSAPCGQTSEGERFATEDRQGLLTEELLFDCGCQTSREEYHDGSVHRMVVNHRHKVLVDEEFRGE